MHLTPQAQAVVLLTVPFGKSNTARAKPLANKEWARFAIWLKDHGLEPAALLKGDLQTLLAGWMDRSVSLRRLEALLGRGAALGLTLEKWQRAGFWILTRSDPDYPERLKRRLRSDSPAVLFGSGNKSLLGRGGIAVVGSRDASVEDLDFTETLGKSAARQGYSIVSGGARGIDQSAMLSALDSDGTAVGVLADSLLKSATSSAYRNRIMSGDLVLISPFNPEAGFNVGNAMSRNRCIYCLADAAVVISSTPNKGGTWNGALEDLRAEWVPLWVRRNSSARSGNPELVKKGARWLPDSLDTLGTLLNGSHSPASNEARRDLPLLTPDLRQLSASGTEGRVWEKLSGDKQDGSELLPSLATEQARGTNTNLPGVDFYSLFLASMDDITSAAPMTVDEIAKHLMLEKAQANAWLKRGIAEGKINKLTKPVRYQSVAARHQQPSLFRDEE